MQQCACAACITRSRTHCHVSRQHVHDTKPALVAPCLVPMALICGSGRIVAHNVNANGMLCVETCVYMHAPIMCRYIWESIHTAHKHVHTLYLTHKLSANGRQGALFDQWHIATSKHTAPFPPSDSRGIEASSITDDRVSSYVSLHFLLPPLHRLIRMRVSHGYTGTCMRGRHYCEDHCRS